MEKLTDIKGIGEKYSKLFNKLEIFSPKDLLYYYPRDYEEYKEPKNIIVLKVGQVETIKVKIVSRVNTFHKGKLSMTYVNVSDGTRQMRATWFNLPYISKALYENRIMILRGRISATRMGLYINQAKIYDVDDYQKIENSLLPIYSLTTGLKNLTIINAIKEVLKENIEIEDYIPSEIRNKRELAELNFALSHIHFPKDFNEMLISRKRLVYDELFLFSIALLHNKRKETTLGLEELKNKDRSKIKDIIKRLPYELTTDQEKALNDIFNDFDNVKLINRLLQGDVGSGKTIIAFITMFYVAFSGFQTAMMAPTEVLAMQHFININQIIKENNLNIKTCLLTSKATAKEKKEIYKKLESGEIQIAIGTHSLLNDDIIYKNLSYVVIDEQHKFGVNQRKALEEKGKKVNVMIMSATPIPRTLAMLLYGDFDISIIKEKPKNRIPIKNVVIGENEREKAYKFIKNQIDKGHQAYIICPLVEGENEVGTFANFQNVIDYTKNLKKFYDKEIRIESLFGKMKNKEKDDILKRFKEKEIDILVSTTVIEVGIDCPNATIIMVEDASQFGLATLHQLRGRVGRSDLQSYAIFVDTLNSDKSKKRLEILVSSNDGFEIAESDLKLRGPGDVFGIRQSGEMGFKVADIYTDYEVFKEAGQDAKDVLKDDETLSKKENKLLKSKLDEYSKNSYTI